MTPIPAATTPPQATTKTQPQAIEWPRVRLASGQEFTLRYTYASTYQLTRWGLNLASADSVALGASMCGSFVDGKWRSTGFERPLDLADLMEPGDEVDLILKVTIAIKNRYPESEVRVEATPGTTTNAMATDS